MRELIIIHGWTYSIEPWNKTVEMLRNDGIKVTQLRVPGLTTPSEKVWTIDDYVQWLRDELVGRKNVAVLGHSNGGRIALHYLATYPNAFEQLILLNSAGVVYASKNKSAKRQLAKIVAKIGKPLAKNPAIRKVFYRLIGSDYGQAPENMKKTLSNMISCDKTFDISKVKAPIIDILWGKADQITPVEMGRLMHERLKESHLKEFGDWQHAPYITHPKQLANAIKEALQ